MRWAIMILLAGGCWAQGVLIDRIAIVVDQSIIKDSDIERDIRVTEFLNGSPLALTQAEKKKAATKLVDQVFLRQEIRQGGYPYATLEQAATRLAELTKDRFRTKAALEDALNRFGLTETTLLDQFRWQVTVLDFINARFKPGVVVSDDAVDKCYRDHLAELRSEDPRGSEDDFRAKARDALTEKEVNRVFFAWLDDRRKSAKINFHEEGLA